MVYDINFARWDSTVLSLGAFRTMLSPSVSKFSKCLNNAVSSSQISLYSMNGRLSAISFRFQATGWWSFSPVQSLMLSQSFGKTRSRSHVAENTGHWWRHAWCHLVWYWSPRCRLCSAGVIGCPDENTPDTGSCPGGRYAGRVNVRRPPKTPSAFVHRNRSPRLQWCFSCCFQLLLTDSILCFERPVWEVARANSYKAKTSVALQRTFF